MKRIFTILIILVYAVTAKADCAGTGIYYWPEGNTIKTNSIIVIDFYAESQNILPKLQTTYPIYLKSGKEKIYLAVTEICKGGFYLTQAILRPLQKLTAGLEYELIIENLPAYERSLQRWNKDNNKYEPVKWKAENTNDLEAPIWTSTPKYISKGITQYGCGPATWVRYDLGFEDKSDVLIKASVRNIKTGVASSYYISHGKGKISIGHSMCSGAFLFDEGEAYEVTFALMDASGNINCSNSDPIKFTAPKEGDKE